MRRRRMFPALLLCLVPGCFAAFERSEAAVPADCLQLVVGVAEGRDSHRGRLFLFERDRPGGAWRQASPAPAPVLFGRSGVAWGIGVAGQEQEGLKKREGDGRAPAGIFRIGRAFGYASAPPEGVTLPYQQVTENDLWIEDPSNPLYNQHVRVEPHNRPAWFDREQMKQNDPAHEWKIEIRHNADPPVPGAGSAIFFHIWRGANRPSSGCTTMSKNNLLLLMRWLRPEANPLFVAIPAGDYQRVAGEWKLPALPGGDPVRQ